MRKPFGPAAALVLAAAPAMAGETCYIPYTMFEAMVPHIDLETCPEDLVPGPDTFCRLALTGDTVRLYGFRYAADDACLEKVESMPFETFASRYGTRYQSE